MSTFLKPQSPLQYKDGTYVYPLTTIDQVITNDEKRLNTVIDEKIAKTGDLMTGLLGVRGLALTYGVDYGPTLPENPVAGQLFLLLSEDEVASLTDVEEVSF